MKTPKYKQNALKRVFALLSCFVFVLTLVCIPVNASSARVDYGTIYYNGTVERVTTSPYRNTWTFEANTNDAYQNAVVYIVYKSYTSTGVWTLYDVNTSYTLQLVDFTNTNGSYAVASAYIGDVLFVGGNIVIEQSLVPVQATPPDIAYVIIANESYEQDVEHIANILNTISTNGIMADYNMLVLDQYTTLEQNAYQDGYEVGNEDGLTNGYQDGYEDGFTDGNYEGEVVGFANGYNKGYDIGYTEGEDLGYSKGFQDGADGIGIEKLPFAITDSIANMFVKIMDFELLGINILSLVGSIISVCVVAFVLKKVL